MFWVYSFLRMPKQCRSYLPAKVWLYWHFSKGHIKKGTLQVGALWVPCVGALMILAGCLVIFLWVPHHQKVSGVPILDISFWQDSATMCQRYRPDSVPPR